MKRLVAGVEIDGIVTTLALVDEFGKIYAKGSFPTSDHKEFKNYVARIKDEIDELSGRLDIPHFIAAVGIGAPNGNYHTGEIENAANLVWKGKLPLAQQLSSLFSNKPVVVTNDANAAAIGEMIYGGAKGMKHFVVITLGTGLGSGIVVDGNVLYGHDGFAGEVGHIIVETRDGRQCGCGRKGCLERYVSSKGVRYTALELLANSSENSKLRDIPAEELTSRDV
ncbi:MAG: ROK family protein, partial [Bacteroidales bacterium]|nr:ROK family protein [Bacteroidales bacterium]